MEATRERRALAAALDAMEDARRRAAGASQLLVAVITSPNEPGDDALETVSDVLDGLSRDLAAACRAAQGATRGGGAE
ncbi:hypothetical protein AUL39_06950 [Tractidigestivibacter scatoligenes]|uniref:Uncharacterized protein n=1 Tax=Tractidigestivibacter scatoligenes TaxID=1299998 RepID=A0A100YWG6_TRASO|nr:hypothetical protein [Tractidigestivibacter scatoligenes]KUH58697.1 hypothetical protein AUL39_06950 [Tractidigestivibacter scatoligenes]